MTIKIFVLTLILYSLTMGTCTYANSVIENISKQKFLRFTDTKEEYGKSCEEYSYISSEQRLELLKENNFMFGDILSDSLSIPSVDPDHLIDIDLTECNMQSMYVSAYTYSENIRYLNDNIITIEVFQYLYGAGAAHGHENISHYIYDREYGMQLDWESLFGKSEVFDKYIFNRVIKEIADEAFITYSKESNELLNFRRPGYFTITDKGLLIQYGKYEITPGSSGLPLITVPKEVLKQYMIKEMYETCFGTKYKILMEARNDH